MTIEKMVTSAYDHIWDCCCDHGLLGAALLSRQAAENIHFVDIVPQLITELETKLHRFHSSSIWETHCLDVAKLPLEQYQGKHLVIIAGIGGDLMIQFIEAINHQHNNLNIDYLLCPVHHQYSLRQKLIELDFGLKDEVLVEEKHRFYEVIFVSSTREDKLKISPVGEGIWQSGSAKQSEMTEQYLTKTLKHYQRIQQGKTNDVQHIIDAYRAISFK